MQFYTYDEIRKDESGSSWWEQIVLRPLVYKLVWLFANYTKFTPNQITIISFLVGLLSAYFFFYGTRFYLVIGALLFEISFILDCIDGRIARLKCLESKLGEYLDIMTDITKYCFIIVCMVYGQYMITKDISLFLYGYAFMALELVNITNKYVINYGGIANKKETTTSIIQYRLPFLMKFKTRIDPENKLGLLPISSIEGQTIAFLIFPILMKVKLGMVIGSIILFAEMLIVIIFKFVIKNKNE